MRSKCIVLDVDEFSTLLILFFGRETLLSDISFILVEKLSKQVLKLYIVLPCSLTDRINLFCVPLMSFKVLTMNASCISYIITTKIITSYTYNNFKINVLSSFVFSYRIKSFLFANVFAETNIELSIK